MPYIRLCCSYKWRVANGKKRFLFVVNRLKYRRCIPVHYKYDKKIITKERITMAKVYYDQDVNWQVLEEKKVAVIGTCPCAESER